MCSYNTRCIRRATRIASSRFSEKTGSWFGACDWPVAGRSRPAGVQELRGHVNTRLGRRKEKLTLVALSIRPGFAGFLWVLAFTPSPSGWPVVLRHAHKAKRSSWSPILLEYRYLHPLLERQFQAAQHLVCRLEEPEASEWTRAAGGKTCNTRTSEGLIV
ncbi:hypothetical protein IQ07DRAFT_139026 [Pyrenochaeta sp. DS3sAY3a]|nr:hypothetical protein IQ07DRAFT_139026 [Pyrenochaeta sp. DS3sAY3a]